MRSSLLIVLFFCLGIACGRWQVLPPVLAHPDASLYALYALLLLVGFGLGCDPRSLDLVRTGSLRVLLVPVAVVTGTLLGAAVVSALGLCGGLRESLAVGAGFGYYSLSSLIIAKFQGAELGTVALLANIYRELATFVLAPLLARHIDKLAPIASGGATAMDTTLVMVNLHSGKEYALVSLCSGVLLTLLVPVLVPFILTVGT